MSYFPGQEYLVFSASNNLWYFYYNQDSIFFKIRNDKGVWSESVRLTNNVVDDFSVDIDPSDKLHLVCMDNTGQMLYFMHDGTHWYNKRLSHFPPEKYSVRHLNVSIWDELINIFFAVNSLRSSSPLWTIQHNFWNGSKWKNLKVARISGTRSFSPFYTGYDYTGTIHLIFKAPHTGVHHLCYCKFHPEYLIWSNPEKIAGTGHEDSQPYMLTDNKDTLHLAWSYPSRSNVHINYLQKTRISYPRGIWKNEAAVSYIDFNNILPVIYTVNRTIWIVWKQQDTLFGSFSYDGGVNWTSPVQLDKPHGSELTVFGVASNSKEYSKVNADLVFGYRSGDDIILPVINEALNKSANEILKKIGGGDKKRGEDGKSVDIDNKKLKEYTDQTKNYISKLSEEIDKVENFKKEVEHKIFTQTNEMVENRQNLEELRTDMMELGEKLDNLKKENSELISSIKNWHQKYKDHEKTIEDIESKYSGMLDDLQRLTEKSIIDKILDYFR